MLSNAQEKLIRSLQTKRGREKSDLCLVEGTKVLEAAGNAVDFTFDRSMSENFADLVTTDTPQEIAGVARIPEWSEEEIEAKKTIVVLDGIQDPGNVGSIIRLCLGFDASLILVESADVTSPKVIRSSVGAVFQVPWTRVKREHAVDVINSLKRRVYRIENRPGAVPSTEMTSAPAVIIMGSEGSGISLEIDGKSIVIEHNEALESLNVTHATAIALYELSK